MLLRELEETSTNRQTEHHSDAPSAEPSATKTRLLDRIGHPRDGEFSTGGSEMHCAKCGAENPAGKRFCSECEPAALAGLVILDAIAKLNQQPSRS